MSTPPANWYPDPRGEAELRYWDGSQWTEHTHSGQPQAAPASPPPAQAPPPQAPAPAGPPAAGTPTAAGGYQQPAYQQAGGPAPGGKGGGSKLPLIIGGALAAVVLVVVLVLVLAGGGDDGGGDEAEAEDAIVATVTGTEPEDCSEGVTQEFVQKLTGLSGSAAVTACQESSKDSPVKEVEIEDVKVDGDRATATVTPKDGSLEGEELAITAVKQGDDWKIDDLDRPSIAKGDAAERAIINQVLNFGSSEGANGCNYLSYAGLLQFGGRAGCESRFAKLQPANYSPEDVQITGRTATMVVTESKRNKTIEFKLTREAGNWKIDSFDAQ
jgi:Protein of unknown function (DUF2510)/Domain of unknown function (DUF4878)